jgi:hypothetical protein
MKRALALLVVAIMAVGTVWAQEEAPRTPAYDDVMQGNIAADFSTNAYLVRPHLIETGFISGSGLTGGPGAGTGNAALSFEGMGIHWLAAMDNTPAILNVRAGMGIANLFGAGILYELNKSGFSTKGGAVVYDSSYTGIGDGMGIFGSYNLLDMLSVYGEVTYATGYASSAMKAENTTTTITNEIKNGTTQIVAGGIMDASGEGTHALGGKVIMTFSGYESITKTGPTTVTNDKWSTFALDVIGSYGTPLRKSDEFAVFLGGDLDIGYSNFKDKQTPYFPAQKTGEFRIGITPNAAFQKTLGKGFEVQCGASVPAFAWRRFTAETSPVEDRSSIMTTIGGSVDLGLCWRIDNFAFEGELSNNLLQNGPYFIGGGQGATNNGPGMFGNVGVSMGF